MKTSEAIKVRGCQIICKENPEWGTWGVMEDHGEWYTILGDSGSRVLYKEDADRSWEVVSQ